MQQNSEDMMKVRNLGRKSLEEVLAKLKELGLQLTRVRNNSSITDNFKVAAP